MANLVPPYDLSGGFHGTSAALEFAVCVLDVQHIIVLGHTDCGGIRALMNIEDVRTYHTDGDFIGQWVSELLPACLNPAASLRVQGRPSPPLSPPPYTCCLFSAPQVKIATPALERTRRYMKNRPLEEQSRYCEEESINVSLANLLTFPWIKEKVTRKELGVHGWLYDGGWAKRRGARAG